MARLSYRRRVTGRRTSARAKSSWSPMTSVEASIRWKPARIRPTARCSRPCCARIGVAEDLAQPLDLGRVVAGDQHAVAGRGAVELGLDPGQLAREPLDALDPQVAGRLQRVGRQRRDGDRGKPDQPLEGALDRVEPARVVDPAQVVPALLAQVVRLDQGDPGAARGRSRSAARSWRGSARRSWAES